MKVWEPQVGHFLSFEYHKLAGLSSGNHKLATFMSSEYHKLAGLSSGNHKLAFSEGQYVNYKIIKLTRYLNITRGVSLALAGECQVISPGICTYDLCLYHLFRVE